MAENLKVTKYNDGTAIPNITDNTVWGSLTTGAYCWYNNDATSYKNNYGALYNWYSVNTGKLAPVGWHVPSDTEWTTLVNYLGGKAVAGGKMKEVGTAHWETPNTGADNSSGFSGLPGGYNGGFFNNITKFGYWWSSSELDNIDAWRFALNLDSSIAERLNNRKYNGFSVRCILGETLIATIPTVSTTIASNITTSSAAMGGSITSDGGSTITAKGICWSTSSNPTISNTKTSDGTGSDSFTSNLIGLAANTTYYARAYATNSQGTAYGQQISFTTLSPSTFATLTTSEAIILTTNSATLGGNITDEGGSSVTERGVVYGTSANPTTSSNKKLMGNGTGSFSATINGLSANTTYYVRAYAINASGVSYGNEVNFTLYLNVPGVSVTDIDGNTYKTVKIGTQTWMVENLKTTKYRNGESIPNITDGSQWETLTAGAYCNYNNLPNNSISFGRYYNWYAVVDQRNLAPEGWHIATDQEWQKLSEYLGGDQVSGGKLKEAGTNNWTSPNSSANNLSGFTALPGGYRNGHNFYDMGTYGHWWTSPLPNTYSYWKRVLSYDTSLLGRSSSLANQGSPVRCIKD